MRYPSRFEIFSVAFAVLIGFFGGVFVTSKFPLPFPDQGHRLFGVRDEAAAKTLVAILGENGLKKKWAFDAGPTHQIVMSDNMTVIAWFDKEAGNLPKNAISVAVENPFASAERAANLLRAKGWKVSLHRPMKDLPLNTLWLIETDAMPAGGLVFRLPFWKMPAPKIRE